MSSARSQRRKLFRNILKSLTWLSAPNDVDNFSCLRNCIFDSIWLNCIVRFNVNKTHMTGIQVGRDSGRMVYLKRMTAELKRQ